MKNFYSFRTKANIHIAIQQPEVEMSVIKRLGKPKFYVSNNDFDEIMGKMYKTASKKALDIALNSGKNTNAYRNP
ncbi:MAG: hypothetical protein V1859_01575 [archaeon]